MVNTEMKEAVKILAQADDYRIKNSEKLKEFRRSFKFRINREGGSFKIGGKARLSVADMVKETWQEILTKRWERIDQTLKQITEIDREILILNTSIRPILTLYLDRFRKLGGQPPTESNLKEIRKLLNSLDYLSTMILELGEKKLR